MYCISYSSIPVYFVEIQIKACPLFPRGFLKIKHRKKLSCFVLPNQILILLLVHTFFFKAQLHSYKENSLEKKFVLNGTEHLPDKLL